MEWHDLLADGYGRVLEALEHGLAGLTGEDLDWQPHPDCNSIGWLGWHITRVQDSQIAPLMGEEQLWIKDAWHARFNRPPDPKDSGFGHDAEQISAFKSPGTSTLLDYHRATLERSRSYFLTLSGDDLDREIDEPWFKPPPTVGVRLVSIMEDSLLHAGQLAYVRGLRLGKGWQQY